MHTPHVLNARRTQRKRSPPGLCASEVTAESPPGCCVRAQGRVHLGGDGVELADEEHVAGRLDVGLGQVANHLQHHCLRASKGQPPATHTTAWLQHVPPRRTATP